MMKTILLLFCLFRLGTTLMATSDSLLAQRTAERVLDKLYQTTAHHLLIKPTLKISQDTQKVAAFYPRTDRIELELQAYRVCRSMGKDSLDALAFILGHELAHACLHNNPPQSLATPSYLAGALSKGQNQEKEADFFGVFNAYLAGYKTIEILPELMERLYDAYDLSDKNMKAYPPLEERKQAAQDVQQKVEQLIQLYEAANYLTALGKYELAALCYRYITGFYQGREIYNNLAVNYTLHAINFTEKNAEHYLYPLELDWTTRLNKKSSDRSQMLTPEEKRKRKAYLDLAEEAIEKTLLLDTAYCIGHSNKICIYSLKKKHRKAGLHYQKINNQIPFSTSDLPILELAAGIAYAQLNSYAGLLEARRIFEKYHQHSNPLVAYQAAYNLKMLGKEKCDALPKYNCQFSSNLPKMVDGVRLHQEKLDHILPIVLNGVTKQDVYISKQSNSTIYQFSAQNRVVLTLQIVHQFARKGQVQQLLGEHLLETIGLNTGYFEVCEEKRLVFRRDEKGRLLEWGQFIK